MDWKNVDTVLLDMDGTLLDLHFDNYFWLEHLPNRYAEQRGVGPDEVREQLLADMDAIRGQLDWYCLAYWSERLEMDMLTLKEEIRHKIAIRPHTEAFLEGLLGAGKRVILATNAHRDALGLKLRETAIDQWLHSVVSSHDFRHPKEAQDFWVALQESEPFDPARTLFVDDSLPVLRSAHKYGIRHLLCVRQPDSRGPVREIDEFPAITHFDEVMPIESAQDVNG